MRRTGRRRAPRARRARRRALTRGHRDRRVGGRAQVASGAPPPPRARRAASTSRTTICAAAAAGTARIAPAIPMSAGARARSAPRPRGRDSGALASETSETRLSTRSRRVTRLRPSTPRGGAGPPDPGGLEDLEGEQRRRHDVPQVVGELAAAQEGATRARLLAKPAVLRDRLREGGVQRASQRVELARADGLPPLARRRAP